VAGGSKGGEDLDYVKKLEIQLKIAKDTLAFVK